MVLFIQVAKNVFVVFYSGERAKVKILKICEVFDANLYPFTEDLGKQKKMCEEVRRFVEIKIFHYFSFVLFISFNIPSLKFH